MQTAIADRPSGQLGFQLPSLHIDIPVRTVLIEPAFQDADPMAKALVELGVIDPETISDSAETPRDVLKQGLAAWIEKRIGRLERLHLTFGIRSPGQANLFVDTLQDADCKLEYTRPVLCIGQTGEEHPYLIDEAAELLETCHAGLFSVIWKTVYAAQAPTVPVRTPEEFFCHFCHNWYECDESELETPEGVEQALESLKERFEDAIEKDYYPENARRVFGMDYLRRTNSMAEDALSDEEILSRAYATGNAYACKVIDAAARLRESIDAADAVEASLPDMTDIHGGWPVHQGSTLVFQDHEFTWQILDDEIEMAYQAGDNTDLMGLRELPADREALNTFFTKLDIALVVLRRFDALLKLISQPH
ncbi:PRTRC system protein F [Noviherbaspirillum pedocola]|uniref:PRTRC system protein F n=1 Tax=Noviherbaspirillum pedocola TaxID=2801341 RepID=A0A934W775_9BURK|nr:PRTRC system protein F [Noviherbaspirillum pedocola]MBK4736045.1 PRTRC system protein F [Noviherbaspirillum pedocola]